MGIDGSKFLAMAAVVLGLVLFVVLLRSTLGATAIFALARLSRLLIRIGAPLHVISTYSSLCTVTPFFVKMEILPSSDVLLTLKSEDGKLSKVSASVV